MDSRRLAAAALAAVLVCAPVFAGGQDAKSPELAKQLAQLLDQKKLDSIAAADKSNPGTYVAALYFPGTQLLVVSAKYTAPQLLDAKLAKKEYREVYIDLSSASIPSSKLFVMDTLADGLVAKPGDTAADSVEKAGTQVTFDGKWKNAKMSEEEYMKVFAQDDADYARVLQMLIDALKTSGT